jgi:hypothetical protein
MLNLTRLHLGIAHESQFQGLGITPAQRHGVNSTSHNQSRGVRRVESCPRPAKTQSNPARPLPRRSDRNAQTACGSNHLPRCSSHNRYAARGDRGAYWTGRGGRVCGLFKRRLGIYFALFGLTLLARDNWEDTSTHPAVQKRINAVIQAMGSSRSEMAYAIARVSFAALRELWPSVPAPSAIDP